MGLFIVALAIPVLLAGAVILAVVVASIHREDRYMSLKSAPPSRREAAARRLLGVGVRRPKDNTDIWAGRR